MRLMTERKHNRLPDKGPKHAVLIALFDGRKDGRVVAMTELKTAIAHEYEDKYNLISDSVVRVTISSLRKGFKEFAPDYKIRNKPKSGYYIEKEVDLTGTLKDALPDKGPKHAVLIALFDGRKAGRIVHKSQLKGAIAREYGDLFVQMSDNALAGVICSLRKVFEEYTPAYKIRNKTDIGYYIVKDSDIINDSQS